MTPPAPTSTLFPYPTLFRSWGKIHKGESVSLPDGRTVAPEALVGKARPGRRFVYSGDTRPCPRSEEHTSELQSPVHLVCRLLLEKKNKSATIVLLIVLMRRH